MSVNILENSMGNIDIVFGGVIEIGELMIIGRIIGGNINF